MSAGFTTRSCSDEIFAYRCGAQTTAHHCQGKHTHTHTVFSVFLSISKKGRKNTRQNCVWVFVSKIEKLKGAVITINISQKRRGTMLVLSFFFLIYSAVIGGGDGGGNTAETSADDKCKCEKTERQWKMHLSSYLSHYHHRRRHHHRYCSSSGKDRKKADRNRSWWLTLTANCWKLSLQLVIVSVDTQKSMALLFHFILSWLPFPLTLSPGSSWSSVVSINAEVDTEVFLS